MKSWLRLQVLKFLGLVHESRTGENFDRLKAIEDILGNTRVNWIRPEEYNGEPAPVLKRLRIIEEILKLSGYYEEEIGSSSQSPSYNEQIQGRQDLQTPKKKKRLLRTF